MSKWMLAAGAAALAIVPPALAEKGGQGARDKGQAAKVERGGGNAKAQRGGQARQMHFVQDEKRGKGQRVRVESRGGNREQSARVDGRPDRGRKDVKIETRNGDRARSVRIEDDRGQGRDRGNVRTVSLDRESRSDGGKNKARFAVVDGHDIVRVRDFDRGAVRFRDVDRDALFVRRLGFGQGGCPPGLAKKPMPCLPPGQAKKLVGEPLAVATRFGALAPLPLSMRSLFWDDDDYYYRYGGGYMYRVDRDDDLIAAMIPLFGAALIGQPIQPSYLNSYYRPSYFNAFYPNSPYDCYRYGYGYIYETDCVTGLVEDVIPTYDYGYGVGQLMPASYGYYNLPYTYRSYFSDDDDYYYRYAPGAIYRVDRSTSLISAVVALLTGGLSVGQPLPVGYSAYNVPLAYRTTYYDRPDVWYRYDNGYIYAVDPGTRMVRSVAYAIV